VREKGNKKELKRLKMGVHMTGRVKDKKRSGAGSLKGGIREYRKDIKVV